MKTQILEIPKNYTVESINDPVGGISLKPIPKWNKITNINQLEINSEIRLQTSLTPIEGRLMSFNSSVLQLIDNFSKTRTIFISSYSLKKDVYKIRQKNTKIKPSKKNIIIEKPKNLIYYGRKNNNLFFTNSPITSNWELVKTEKSSFLIGKVYKIVDVISNTTTIGFCTHKSISRSTYAITLSTFNKKETSLILSNKNIIKRQYKVYKLSKPDNSKIKPGNKIAFVLSNKIYTRIIKDHSSYNKGDALPRVKFNNKMLTIISFYDYEELSTLIDFSYEDTNL